MVTSLQSELTRAAAAGFEKGIRVFEIDSRKLNGDFVFDKMTIENRSKVLAVWNAREKYSTIFELYLTYSNYTELSEAIYLIEQK